MSTPEIHTDELTRRLYANDASMYEALPSAVAFPESENDIRQLLDRARGREWPLTFRSAGTSLAGQSTGAGLIVDMARHMNRITHIDPATARASVQPGVIRDTLNRAVAPHNLHFAPDTATTNRCMIGGMIGNNSAGIYSYQYGTTRDHVHAVRAMLSDGTVAVFEPLSPEALARKRTASTLEGRIYAGMLDLLDTHAELIRSAYPHPDIIRRNTGYALDRLAHMQPVIPTGRPFNLAELLCGSEGTLAVTLEATLLLNPTPAHRVLVIPHFESVYDAVEAVEPALQKGVAAVELIDDMVLSATLNNAEQRRNRFFLEGAPHAILIIECQAATEEEAAALAEDVGRRLLQSTRATDAPVIREPADMARVWELRKAGLGLLMGLWSEKSTPEFIEDTAVRVADLPAYVRDVQSLMDRYGTRCVYYGHASVGELHLRPELNLSTPEGIEQLKDLAIDMAELVHTYRGSLSGEHGDGRSRSPYIEKVLGTEMMPVLEQVKRLWDPDHVLNPGKIVAAEPIERPLRVQTGHPPLALDTVFRWRDNRHFGQVLDRCNGAGVCRKLAESGGTMCPSYMVTRDEKDSTRGRANLFRQLFRGQQAEAFASDDLKTALDLCLSCKACKTECPANVDMARMKAEFMNGWHQRKGTTRAERFFARPDTMLRWGARMPRLANLLAPLGRPWLSIHPNRSIPPLAERSLTSWYRGRTPPPSCDGPRVVLLNDHFMNYLEPSIGQATIQVLETLGCRVELTPPVATGRTAISMGFLDDAKDAMARLLPYLHERVQAGYAIIGQEPSELLTIRDEWLDLVDTKDLPAVRTIADHAFLLEEYLLHHGNAWTTRFDAAGATVRVHGHCHAKALTGMQPLCDTLSAVGYQVVSLDTGCCGMAGSFGFDARTYDLSMQIGELRLFPEIRALEQNALVCAHGFSCRHQILDGTGHQAYHPAELLARAVKG